MARLPRVYVPDLSVHVFQRGHNRRPLFHEPSDYTRFTALLVSAVQHYAVNVHVFALMTNHYHLIATPTSSTALPRAMKQLHGDYVRYYNRKNGCIGTVWGGRYHAKSIEDERYWWTCVRYVETNPVEAGLVDSPEEYEWSSYRVYALGVANSWLQPHPLYNQLGSCKAERQRAYRAICLSK